MGFPDVFGLFGPLKVGEFSFWYSWTTGMKKSWQISSSKKVPFQDLLKFSDLQYFWLFVHNFLPKHLNRKSWRCFWKFRKFAASQFKPTLKYDLYWRIRFLIFLPVYINELNKWNFAHMEWSKQYKNSRKTPQLQTLDKPAGIMGWTQLFASISFCYIHFWWKNSVL